MLKDKQQLENDFYNLANELTKENGLQFYISTKDHYNTARNLKLLTGNNLYVKTLFEISAELQELETKEKRIDETIISFCPFGYLDIKTAFDTVLEAGEEPETFISDVCEEEAQNMGCLISDIDPNYCVYENLKNKAIGELVNCLSSDYEDKINELFEHLEVYGNYLDTRFNNFDESQREQLQSIIDESQLTESDFPDVVKWFLNQLEIKIKE